MEADKIPTLIIIRLTIYMKPTRFCFVWTDILSSADFPFFFFLDKVVRKLYWWMVVAFILPPTHPNFRINHQAC